MTLSGRYSEDPGAADIGLPKLTPTGWTVLGFLSLSSRNGYQLRQAVQRSVGHFWGVSYGQLYPQLKHLEASGLIAADEPAAERGRQTVWQLTEQGATALDGWLSLPAQPAQRRDEGMVKLLFSDHAGPRAMLRLIEQRRDEAHARRDQATATVPGAQWPEQTERSADTVPATWLVRAHTIALADAELAWCDQAQALIAEQLGASSESDDVR
ncbi:PadR family transcriptional regulator [Kitasatospora sp. NPDC058397]|uniref:PadR family transcriptional regulator n=1 Tax=unclassified Kitasatospora TaxID=2633591 RepID=UPI003658F09F